MSDGGNVHYRRIPWLTQILEGLQRRSEAAALRAEAAAATATAQQQLCNNRKYHLASARLTAIILLGGSVNRTLTWSAPFDDDQYAVEFVLVDLEGSATVSEVSRTASTITVSITATTANVSLGATFLVFGRSL